MIQTEKIPLKWEQKVVLLEFSSTIVGVARVNLSVLLAALSRKKKRMKFFVLRHVKVDLFVQNYIASCQRLPKVLPVSKIVLWEKVEANRFYSYVQILLSSSVFKVHAIHFQCAAGGHFSCHWFPAMAKVLLRYFGKRLLTRASTGLHSGKASSWRMKKMRNEKPLSWLLAFCYTLPYTVKPRK